MSVRFCMLYCTDRLDGSVVKFCGLRHELCLHRSSNEEGALDLQVLAENVGRCVRVCSYLFLFQEEVRLFNVSRIAYCSGQIRFWRRMCLVNNISFL